MKKMLAILMSFGLTTTMMTNVVACKAKPERANDHDLFFIEPQQKELVIDESGKQEADFDFTLSYLSHSPTTNEATNIEVTSIEVANELENPSNDTSRYGHFFNVNLTMIKSQVTDDETKMKGSLKFNSLLIQQFIDLVGARSLLKFEISLNFKGTYYKQEDFSVTLNFRFDFINHFNSSSKQDLKNYIPENQRNLGVVKLVNDTTFPEDAQELIKNQIYTKFHRLISEVLMDFNLIDKTVKITAKPETAEFIGDVTVIYAHDKNPEILPDVSDVNLGDLPTNRLEFSQWTFDQKAESIKTLLKKWYALEKGQESTDRYFQYFKIPNQTINIDSTSATVNFETPWASLNKSFPVKFMVPYASISTAIPADFFAEELLKMTETTSDNLILFKLHEKAISKRSNFDDDFAFGQLNVNDPTVEIVAKKKSSNQIYEPDAKLSIKFNVAKQNLTDDNIIGNRLNNFQFNAAGYGVYYLSLREIIFNRISYAIDAKLADNYRKAFVSLENDWNKNYFDSLDSDTWTIKLTPSPAVQRYVTGEITFPYTNPGLSALEGPVLGITYDTPGLNQTLQLSAPFLVSTDAEVQANYLKILNETNPDLPFSKYVIIANPEKKIDLTMPDLNQNYYLHGAEKVKKYITATRYLGVFRLGKLDLASFFFGGINLNTPLDSSTAPEISKELYDIITKTKSSPDFPGYENLKNAVEVIDVQISGKTGSAQLKVKPGYKYTNYVLNQATINFKLK